MKSASHLLRVLCAIFFVLSASREAAAQSCSASMSQLAFGSIDVLPGNSATTAGTLAISCTGQPNSTIRVCASIGGPTQSGRRFMSTPGGANNLLFDVFSDASLSTIWGSYSTAGTGVQLDLALGADGNGSETRSVYAGVYGQQQTAQVGTYSASLQGGDTTIVYGYNSGLSCSGLSGSQSALSVSATASVAAHCNVTAGTLDFGTVSVLNQNVDASSAVSVQCSSGIPYTVGLSGGGAHATDPTARKMSSGVQTITYGLYHDASRSQGWGNIAGGNAAAGTGSSSFQVLTVYGRVPPQVSVGPGTFGDTIVVTVDF